jgi:hypothetical protein
VTYFLYAFSKCFIVYHCHDQKSSILFKNLDKVGFKFSRKLQLTQNALPDKTTEPSVHTVHLFTSKSVSFLEQTEIAEATCLHKYPNF